MINLSTNLDNVGENIKLSGNHFMMQIGYSGLERGCLFERTKLSDTYSLITLDIGVLHEQYPFTLIFVSFFVSTFVYHL